MIRLDSAITDVHAKGGCYLCGNPNNLVDTEVSIPYEGVLAICRGCAWDIATVSGFDLTHTTRQWEKLLVENEENKYLADSALKALSDIHETTKKAKANHQGRLRQRATRAAEQEAQTSD